MTYIEAYITIIGLMAVFVAGGMLMNGWLVVRDWVAERKRYREIAQGRVWRRMRYGGGWGWMR